MQDAALSKYVNVTVPPVLFGGNPRGLFEWMKLQGQPLAGRPGVWRVCTEENYLRRPRPGLLRYRKLAGPGVADNLARVLDTPVRGSTVEAEADAIELVNALGRRLEQSSEIVDMFTHIKLSTMVAPDSQLSAVLSAAVEAIRCVPFEGEPEGRPFESARVHLAQRDPALTHRIKFPSVWLRFDYDERLADGETPTFAQDPDGDPGFAAAFDLHSGMMLLEVYFGPLAGCLSPYVWCLLVARNHGVLVLDLGTVLRGTRSEVSELLQVLPTYGTDRKASRPRLSPEASSCDAQPGCSTW